jgi:hypothetical protein
MSFSFGANPVVADDGSVHAEPPKDARDKLIEELQTTIYSLSLETKQLKKDKVSMSIELSQTKELLVNVQAPTVFNQIQVY